MSASKVSFSREYQEDQIALIKAMIDKNGILKAGDICPICHGHYERILDHITYDPVNKTVTGLGQYFLICSGCGFRVKDVWEVKEEWSKGMVMK